MAKRPLARWLRWYAGVLLLAVFPGVAAAQEGRLIGTVTDAATGTPIPGATVVIVGTQQGAATDARGQYAVIGIRPGTYDIRASFVGYTPRVLQGVQIPSDRTTTVDFELSTEVVQAGEVVVMAEQPVVDQTQTTSRALVTGEEISRLPVSSIQDVIARTSNSYEGFLRGSRRFETRTVIEGIDVSDAFYAITPTASNAGGFSGLVYNNTNKSAETNPSLFSVNPDIVSEVTVNTGATDPRFSTGTGGLVAITLQEGSGPITGSVSARITPRVNRPGPDSLTFYGHQEVEAYLGLRDALLASPDTRARGELFTWTPDRYGESESPEVDLRFNVGGSITDRWTFLLSGQGFQTSGFQPNEFRRRAGGTLKTSYRVAGNSRLTALAIVEDRGLWGGWSNRSYHDFWRYYLEGVAENDGGSYLGSLRWTQGLSASSLLDVQVYRTSARSRYGYRDPSGESKFLDFYDPAVIGRFVGPGETGRMFATNYSNAFANITGLRQDNFTLRAAQPMPYAEDAANSVNGLKVDYSNQISFHHFVQGGLELKLRHFDYNQVYGIDGDGAKLNNADADGNLLEPFVPTSFTRNPTEFAVYASDRMQYGGLIVNLGLRVEFVNRDMEKIADYYHPFVRDTIEVDGRRLARNFFNRSGSVPTDVFFNPRIGVSHPIGERAAMYFSYARNRQLPPYTQLYEWYDGNHSNNPFFVYQNPEQDPITSDNYELGVQWEFAEGWGADVNAYMRSIENYGSLVLTATNRNPPGSPTLVGTPHRWATSFGYAESRGIEVVLRRRPLRVAQDVMLGLTTSYTYSTVEQAQSAGSTTTSFADNDPANPTTRLPFEVAREANHFPFNVRGGASTLTGGYDRRHRVVVRSVAALPYEFSAGVTAAYESGFLYQRQIDVDPRARELATGPSNFRLDLRLENRISFTERFGLDLYVDVINLTDRNNIIAYNANPLGNEFEIFERTGNPGSRLIQRDGSALYGPARSIYFGTRVRL